VTRAVAYFGTYDPEYPRNAVLLAGLRECGVQVWEFRAPLPDMAAAEMATAAGAARLAAGLAAAHARLLAQHRRHLSVDTVLVGYPGHFLVPFGLLLADFRQARLVFDPLVSLWDTFAGDRGLLTAEGWKAAAVRAVDDVAFRVPHLVLADTWAHATYYQQAFALARERVAVVPVGALPEPRALPAARAGAPERPLIVFQYGKWSPLHGADVVLRAADRLRAEPVRFVLAGEGQLSTRLKTTIAGLGLENVVWLGSLTMAQLRDQELAADVCLGVFGGSEKAGRVIPNKVYDALACGRPVVTADSPGARELLHHEEDAVLVPVGDDQALAAAVSRLRDDGLRRRLGEAALALYRSRLTPAVVAGELLSALEGLR